ncbi:MAG: hypothetical protein CL736_03360 [Chloroflexi bacterium]|nr:hypothetical protein [Chloroflexota bacterium]
MKNLKSELISRIKEHGPITFENYMDLCLYWPKGGFYTGNDIIIHDDYYTSPMAHPAFGALLSLYLESLWKSRQFNNKLFIMEIGAGNYQLANDITNYSKNLSTDFYNSIDYITIDIRKPQKPNNNFSPIISNTIPFNKFTGIIILNEVFDAFPFHRIIKINNQIKEIYVDYKDGDFFETYGPVSSNKIFEFLQEHSISLDENQINEISLKSTEYLKNLSSILDTGVIVNIDYGDTSENLLSKFKKGSLSCYFEHTMSQTPFLSPGKQDITCHVNFSALISEATQNNLESSSLISQREFLYQQGFEYLLSKLRNLSLNQHEINSNRMGMLSLVDPNGLGNFKTLIHSKNIKLSKLNFESQLKDLKDKYPVPLLDDHHINLFGAKYPDQAQNWNDLFKIK